MFADEERRRRIGGAALVIAGLVSAATGYAFVVGVDPLKAAVPMQTAGSVGLALVLCLAGRSPFRRYRRRMRVFIVLLALGNAAVTVAIPYANESLTLGGTAAMIAFGGLSVGLWKILRNWRTAWGLKHLLGRLVVLLGVAAFNKPWEASPDWAGLGFGLIAALGAWNTVTVLGLMKRDGLEGQGAAAANLLAVVFLCPLVVGLRGAGWVSADLFVVAGLAGLFTVLLPVLLLNGALRFLPGRAVGAVQSLTSPVYALVGMIGAVTGLLGDSQRITLVEWAAIMVIAGAAFAVSQIKELPGDGGAAARRA